MEGKTTVLHDLKHIAWKIQALRGALREADRYLEQIQKGCDVLHKDLEEVWEKNG